MLHVWHIYQQFGPFLEQMFVNIPYMEHMVINFSRPKLHQIAISNRVVSDPGKTICGIPCGVRTSQKGDECEQFSQSFSVKQRQTGFGLNYRMMEDVMSPGALEIYVMHVSVMNLF